MKHFGRKLVTLYTASGTLVSTIFEVVDVRRPILSVARLTDKGYRVHFAGDDSHIVSPIGDRHDLRRRGGLFILDVRVAEGREVQTAIGATLMPVEVDSDHGEEVPGSVPMGGAQSQPVPVREPIAPTEAQQRQHNLTHLPFASWCARCVQAKGHDAGHVTRSEEEKQTVRVDELPVVQVDFSFLDGTTLLTMFSMERGAGAATALPDKSSSAFTTTWMCRSLRAMGHGPVILQCDQEPSIRAVVERAAERRSERTLVRETPRRSHQSLGGDERWNQSVQE